MKKRGTDGSKSKYSIKKEKGTTATFTHWMKRQMLSDKDVNGGVP